jgi:glycosyltransferase involved in cell wall biosynthesis
MPRPRILFIAPHPVEGPSTRYRITQYLPYLEAAEIDWELRPFLTSRCAPLVYGQNHTLLKFALTAWGGAGRCVDVARARHYDLIYLLREAFPIGPPIFERLLAMSSGRLIFDFDDAIYHRALNYDNPLDRLRDWNRPAKIIGRATRVNAGSNILADFARRHAPDPDRVVMLPTVVDTTRFVPSLERQNSEVTIGWIGTPRNTIYLRLVWDAFENAAKRDPRIRFVFVGAEPFPVGDVKVEFRPWTLAREISDVQGFDIGIMPLPDDEQTRGKCGFKLIAYMSCGIPTIASPVGANCDVVTHGETGILASTPHEWTEAILRLAEDRSLRRKMGASGRCEAEARFSLAATAPKFVDLVREAIAS